MYGLFSRSNASKWGPRLLPLLLAAAALLIRWPNLTWGLPDIEEEALPLKKAFDMWGWDAGRIQWNPKTAGWPSFSFYVHLGLQQLDYLLGRLAGAYSNRDDFWVAYQLDPTHQVLLARRFSAFLGAGTVYVGAWLAARLGGRAAAVAAGGVLALSPLALSHSQMITPDILLTFFVALAARELLLIRENGRTKHYVMAAVWLGLGSASKYTPVLLTLSLYAIHLLRMREEGLSLRMLGLNDRRLGYAALASILTFCLASPFTLGDIEVLRRDMSYQAMHMSRGHFGHESRSVGYGYYVFDVLVRDLGWPVFLASAGGLVLLARQSARGAMPLLAFLPFYLVLGSLGTQFDRYMLPALMPLCLGLAGIFPLVARLPLRRFHPVLYGLLIAGMLITPWRGARAHHSRQSALSTQQLAKSYIFDSIPAADSYLIMEQYTPFLPLDVREEMRLMPIFERLNDEQRRQLLERPYYNYQYIPMYSARTELTAFYYDLRHFMAYDYIVISSSVRGRYLRQREQFPRQLKFYEDLEVYTEEVARFTPDMAGRGPAIFIFQFSPDGRERLIRDRGKLDREFVKPFVGEVYAEHILGFLDSAAHHALEQGEFELAELFFNNLYSIAPAADRPILLEQMAYANLELGRWRRARSLYQQLVTLAPDNPAFSGGLGYVLLQMNELDAAEQMLMRSLRLSDTPALSAWAEKNLAELRERRKAP
jgi:tetratricopeptide (TPR) repeat protein